jgi:hypothetical protein
VRYREQQALSEWAAINCRLNGIVSRRSIPHDFVPLLLSTQVGLDPTHAAEAEIGAAEPLVAGCAAAAVAQTSGTAPRAMATTLRT